MTDIERRVFFGMLFPPETTGKRLVEDILSYNGILFYIHRTVVENDTMSYDIAKRLNRYEGPMFIKPMFSHGDLESGFGWNLNTIYFFYDLLYQSEQLYDLIKMG